MELSTNTCNYMGESQNHYAKWKQPSMKDCALYDFIYIAVLGLSREIEPIGDIYMYKRDLLHEIGSCDNGGWKLPRSIVSKLETKETQWGKFQSESQPQEEPMFQFKSKGRKRPLSQLKVARQEEPIFIQAFCSI